jgi:predicted NACHT family NTPase
MSNKLKDYWDKKERSLVAYRDCVLKSLQQEEDIPELLYQGNALKFQFLNKSESKSLDYLFHTSKHLLILSSPGSGKTTFINYLAAAFAKGQIRNFPNLPVVISLNTYQAGFFVQSIQNQFHLLSKSSIAEDDIKTLLVKGKISLLLDGLDECTYAEKITEDIQRFAFDYPLIPIIVTHRYKSSLSIPGFTSAHLLPLENEDIRLITNHLCSKYRVDSQKLWLNLMSNSTLLFLAKEPFQLHIIVKIYKEKDQKPISINILLDLLISKKLKSIPISKRNEIQDLATIIALYLEKNNLSEFIENDIRTFDEKIGSKGTSSNFSLQENLSQLCKIGILTEEDGRFRFIHLLMQEYFASQISSPQNTYKLLSSLQDEDENISKKFFTRCLLWDEKLDTDKLIIELLKSNKLLAKSYVADFLIDNPTSTNTQKLVLNFLLEETSQSSNWAFRTCDALASLKNEDLTDYCHYKLNGENLTSWEATLITYILSMQGKIDKNGLEFLFQATRDSDPLTRSRAYRALVATKFDAALIFIIDRLKNEKDDTAYEDTILELANINNLPERIPPSSYTTMLVDLEKRISESKHPVNDNLCNLMMKFVGVKSQDKGEKP